MAATQPATDTRNLDTVAGGFRSQACQDSANPRGKLCGNLEVEPAPYGAAREAYEELGIVIDPSELVFTHLIYFVNEEEYGPAFATFFIARAWTGTPRICEPDECDELDWCTLDNLPQPIVPYVAGALEHIGIPLATGSTTATFNLHGWPRAASVTATP